MHGGHFGIQFEKKKSTMTLTRSSAYCGENSCFKVLALLLNFANFGMVAMLATILKTSLRRCSPGRANIVEKKMCQNTRIEFFISSVFVHGGHFGKKVDEDAPGIEPILHRENRFIFRYHLGVGEHTHTHTHTHTHAHREVSNIYSPRILTNHEWLCGNKELIRHTQ